MISPRIISVSTGPVRDMVIGARPGRSGIDKRQASEPVAVSMPGPSWPATSPAITLIRVPPGGGQPDAVRRLLRRPSALLDKKPSVVDENVDMTDSAHIPADSRSLSAASLA